MIPHANSLTPQGNAVIDKDLQNLHPWVRLPSAPPPDSSITYSEINDFRAVLGGVKVYTKRHQKGEAVAKGDVGDGKKTGKGTGNSAAAQEAKSAGGNERRER